MLHFSMIRLRLKELLRERGMTAYAFAKASKGRVSLSGAYRVVRLRGRLAMFDARLIEAMLEAFSIEPGELFTQGRRPRASKQGRN